MAAEVLQRIQERKLKIKEIKATVVISNKDADREISDGEQVFTALIGCVEKCREDFNQTVKEKLKSTAKQAEDLIIELEQEMEDLTNRSSEVKQLSHTEDHLHFLQTFRSLKNPPSTRDWTAVEVHPPSYVGTLRRSLDQLEETLNMEMKKLHEDAELTRVQQYEVDVTLDPDTAHPNLILSEDGKQVHDGGVGKETLLLLHLPEPPTLVNVTGGRGVSGGHRSGQQGSPGVIRGHRWFTSEVIDPEDKDRVEDQDRVEGQDPEDQDRVEGQDPEVQDRGEDQDLVEDQDPEDQDRGEDQDRVEDQDPEDQDRVRTRTGLRTRTLKTRTG
ncbi:unnamed protein product [Gadus morhua 'NCC']